MISNMSPIHSLLQWPVAYYLDMGADQPAVLVPAQQISRGSNHLPLHVPFRGLYANPVNDCSQLPAFWATTIRENFVFGLIHHQRERVRSKGLEPAPLYFGHWIHYQTKFQQ